MKNTIRKLEVEDIVKILTLKDNVFETIFPCTKGEWVQFLIPKVDDENFLMLGVFSSVELVGYVICSIVNVPPLINNINIIYYVGSGGGNTRNIVTEIKRFAIRNKARSITFETKTPDVFLKYGCKQTSVNMELVI